jgi:hypothetical protein
MKKRLFSLFLIIILIIIPICLFAVDIDGLKDKALDIVKISSYFIAGLAIIVKMTPTKKDDMILNKYIVKPVDAISKFIFWWTRDKKKK